MAIGIHRDQTRARERREDRRGEVLLQEKEGSPRAALETEEGGERDATAEGSPADTGKTQEEGGSEGLIVLIIWSVQYISKLSPHQNASSFIKAS